MKANKYLLAYLAISVPVIATLLVASTLSLYVKNASSSGSYGEIALRSYYESGSGDSVDDPYVITKPRHLYNLSRLQGLGVYGHKKYFRIGKVGLNGDTSGLPVCYASDSSGVTVPYLDMAGSGYGSERIIAIGSESTPFYGEFDGNNVEIKNLTVYADPEDAGLFGYTAHTSKIKNLFLDNITIDTLGYESVYEKLYSDSYTLNPGEQYLRESVSLIYGTDLANPTKVFAHGSEEYSAASFDCQAYFRWLSLTPEEKADTELNPEPTLPSLLPAVGYRSTNNSYKYKFLTSGSFLNNRQSSNREMELNLKSVFEFFHSKMELAKTDPTLTYPLQASSSVSLVASTTDNDGIDHSRVLLTLEFDFTLASADATSINLMVRLGKDHSNNIGLIIGHCDGSVDQCFVHNGNFKMNKKPVGATGTYRPMANGSELGLIGLVGGTVYNLTAKESDASAQAGKAIGVLDFTTIFDDVVDEHSYDNATLIKKNDKVYATTFTPNIESQYIDFIRRGNVAGLSGIQYITAEDDDVNKRHRKIAFKGQETISNTDLGVFTIVTDYDNNGLDASSTVRLDRSLVTKEQLDVGGFIRPSDGKYVNGDFYLYYATGEYRKGAYPGLTFDKYRDDFDSDRPTQLLLGHHLPNKNEVSVDSFNWRELHHNYYFRFKLEPDYRSGRGLYFSDVDDTTIGGSYLSKYFNYKLIDESNVPIPSGPRSGVALWNSSGHEIREFSSSFVTSDNSLANEHMTAWDGKIANSVNFEITTDYANITVVASPAEKDKPAALGVYNTDYAVNMADGSYNVTKHFDDPDYAFFMPRDERLAYFDYNTNRSNGKGEIGVYDHSSSSFKTLEQLNGLATESTIAKAPGVVEHGYPTDTDISRLYVHTFKLPHGKYCLGSPTGINSLNDGSLGVAKIFYVAAQGQTDGQIDFANNVFVSNDKVENIDFLTNSRYDANGKISVLLDSDSELPSALKSPDIDQLANRRCYISLLSSDRSRFYATEGELTFAYNNGTFYITKGEGELSAIEKVAVTSYKTSKFPSASNIPVNLLGYTGLNENGVIKYPQSQSG